MKTTNYGFLFAHVFFAFMQHPRHRVPAVSLLIGDNVMIKQGVGQLTHLLYCWQGWMRGHRTCCVLRTKRKLLRWSKEEGGRLQWGVVLHQEKGYHYSQKAVPFQRGLMKLGLRGLGSA